MVTKSFRVRARGLRGPGLTSEQQAALDGAVETGSTAARTVATFAERNAIIDPPNGLTVKVMEPGDDGIGGREFVWTWGAGGGFGLDEWVAKKTEAELLNLGNSTGNLSQGRINGLPEALSGLDTVANATNARVDAVAARALHVSSLKVAPPTLPPGGVVSTATVSWSVAGTPEGQHVEWANGKYRAYIQPEARQMTIPPSNWSNNTVIAIGDSIPFNWAAQAAASLGKTLVMAAIYAQDLHKQALRVGAMPTYLTLAGGYLPANGGVATVSLLNGQPTSYDNPDAFLSAYDGDPTTDGWVSAGTLYTPNGSRHATMTHNPATEEGVYHIASDAGAAGMAVPAGSLFVPDMAAMMGAAEVWIQEDALSPLSDLEAIVRMTRGNRVLILSALNDITAGPDQLAARQARNAEVRARYPQYYVTDAQGRDVLDRMLLLGSGSREDGLHPSATGKALIVSMVTTFRAANPPPAAILVDEGIAVTAMNALGPDTQTTRILPVQDVTGMTAEITATVLEAVVDAPAGFAPWASISANTAAVSGGQYEMGGAGAAFTLTLPAGGGVVRVLSRRDGDIINGNGRTIAAEGASMQTDAGYEYLFRVVGTVWVISRTYIEGAEL